MFDTRETRIVGLPYGEETMTIRQDVSIECPKRDRRTDRQTDRQNCYINIAR